MKTPAFWYEHHGALAQFLRPPGFVYGTIAARRMAHPGVRLSVPVVTIGNFVAGGAGKTPAALAIARMLIANGHAPAFVSRGYGGSADAPMQVLRQDASDVGDEPLLLARVAPTFVGADRIAAGMLALQAASPDILVLDDGLQSRRIEPDAAIAIVDGEAGAGNGFCLPAGPLRAPLDAQLRHVDAVVIVGAGAKGEAIVTKARGVGLPVFRADIIFDDSARALAGRKVVPFAGIGRPSKFFATLKEIGAEIVARKSFADHHRYSLREMSELRALAMAHKAQLVTTEKDLVRLPIDMRGETTAVAVRMVFTPDFERFLLNRLQAKTKRII